MYIDNFICDPYGQGEYMRGTTRSRDKGNPGDELHIWRLKRTCDFRPNVSWPLGQFPCTGVNDLDLASVSAGSDSYVAGIVANGSKTHLIIAGVNGK